ncbi:bifunctional hydroxymethylpyrimidine kinase/phosphomethylpyrimidine kinase [Dactylosporangium roseum]|uniref:Bifunctional hydroxymethylpyrimidine kinase/phosphomethylpyrimidine kinase n=1 Tax=Dactylosporangium roseum TaxID=47989 RepID=A0ABY5ZDT4_9ACTN|nr:PfkB family carbohydrate kinase [Dactylosporangium roseum]UWZ38838.1 bifunctional hydroxymethylpyrimidine kinase/phosphomethylpyrimidine kinase [Dactylosporangium roseum]
MGESVLVFAPVPVLTVTVEQQVEAVELHLHPGGQGVWQARMISALGSPVTLCAALGGETGEALSKLIEDQGLTLRAVRRSGESGWYVHDRRQGQRREIAAAPGAPLARHDLDELHNLALAEGLKSAVAVLSGPADPSVVAADVYRRLAMDLAGNGVRVVADLSGTYLDAVAGAGVAVLKVSHEELLDHGRAASASLEDLVEAGRRLKGEGAEVVLVSRAEEPALAFFDDRVMLVRVPPLQVVEHRGAGDSMSAGVAAVLARGGTIEEAIRTGAAAGALNVTRHGLGTGRAEAIAELIPRVELEPLRS